jgi:Domain of unknown function (DUF5666)
MKASYRNTFGFIALLAVAACGGGGGGGGGVAGSGIGGTGVATGTVTAIGSVVVNGIRFDCKNATVTSDDSPPVSQGDDRCVVANQQGLLKPGMVVKVEGSIDASGTTGTATKVTFRDNLEGPVASIDPVAHTLVVLGKTIIVDDATIIEVNDVKSTFSAITVNMVVQVSGLPDGQGQIIATHIENKPGVNPTTGEFELKGIITSVSATGATIGSLTLLTATPPAVGACVEVKGTLAGNTLTVTSIKPDDDCNGASFSGNFSQGEVEGIVNGFVDVSNFKVGNQSVNATNATFLGGVADDLADGVKVEVEGNVSNGVLVAKKVALKTSIKIEAAADANGSDSSVSVLGITVNKTAATELKDITALSQIKAGDKLRIRGSKSGSGVSASRIEKRNGGNNDTIIQGPLEAKLPSIKILGITVLTDNTTQFKEGQTSFLDDSKTPLNTTVVKAKGSENPDNTLDARGGEIEIEN